MKRIAGRKISEDKSKIASSLIIATTLPKSYVLIASYWSTMWRYAAILLWWASYYKFTLNGVPAFACTGRHIWQYLNVTLSLVCLAIECITFKLKI